MPPVTSSSSVRDYRHASKKVVIQKPKGAVRAKSGCYTCRIRRKKCDERRMGGYEDGPCETCARLKLECLGFGAKRPDWLRDNSKVAAIRDRIKAHLAAQGMIKGHAGSGSRSTVHEEFLRLSDPRDDEVHFRTVGSSSSTDGSPIREQSVDSEHPYGARPRISLITRQYSPEEYSYVPDSRSVSPANYSAYDLYQPASFPDVHNVFAPQIPMASTLTTGETAATRSSFSPLYHANIIVDEIVETPFHPNTSISYYPPALLPAEAVDSCIRDYVGKVVRIQYLLGDRNLLPSMIWESVHTNRDSHEAVFLLAKVYYSRQYNAYVSVSQNSEVNATIDALQQSLHSKTQVAVQQSVRSKPQLYFTADDAMTALHVVSLYLFEGGHGRWDEFLCFASAFATRLLNNPRYRYSAVEALENANQKEQFVIKTTIWFDVLASITVCQEPHLLRYIQELFQPNGSWVGAPPRYSMLSPMGCENRVVWALAQTVALAEWKELRAREGVLSLRELMRRAAEIDEHLGPVARPQPPPHDADASARAAAAEIFRTSTRLFLRSVESGAFPDVPDVRECAEETYHAIMDGDVQPYALALAPPQTRSAVVRSSVFGIYICGSLTDDPVKRQKLRTLLLQHAEQEGVGNCAAVCVLLDGLWQERDNGLKTEPVRWRERLHEERILLV